MIIFVTSVENFLRTLIGKFKRRSQYYIYIHISVKHVPMLN
jgi:hypothetical protein